MKATIIILIVVYIVQVLMVIIGTIPDDIFGQHIRTKKQFYRNLIPLYWLKFIYIGIRDLK